MKIRQHVGRVCVALAFVVIAGLWLKELTERRARRAADAFMGFTLTRVGWEHDTFIPGILHSADGHRYGPGWLVSYSTYFALGEPVSLYVDLSGRVRTATSQKLIEWIGLPEKERLKKQEEFVREDIAFREKEDREEQQRKAEQSAAPLPSAPQSGPSDGAR